MANVKFISIFLALTSLLIVIMSTQVCNAFGSSSQDVRDNIIFKLYDLDALNLEVRSCEVGQQNNLTLSQINLTSQLTNASNALVTPASGSSGSVGVSVLIDLGKLVLGLVSLVLGLPLYTFLFNIGLNTIVATILSAFLGLMQIYGIAEFMRGGSL